MRKINHFLKINIFVSIFICSLFLSAQNVKAVYEKKTGVNINKAVNVVCGIHIYWDKMEDVDGYSIYRKKAADSSFSYLRMVSKEICDYLDESAEQNEIYSYKICSYNYIDGKRSFGYFGNIVSSAAIKYPGYVNVYPNEEGLDVRWEKVDDCNGYSIYRKSMNENNYTYYKLVNSDTNSFLDKDAEKGKMYSYKVYAYVSYYAKRYFSAPSAASAYRPYIDTPSISSVEKSGKDSLIIKWDKINYADGYSVYRKAEGESVFTYLKMVSTLSYTDKSVDVNKKYTYKVCAYISNNGQRSFGNFSEPVKYSAYDSPRHMLTIIDDDGYNTFYDIILPIIERKGVSISTAVETGNVGTADFMTWEKIEECHNRGAEILNHSRDHICLREENEKRTDDEIKDDMLSAVDMMVEHGYSETAYIYVYPGASAGRTWSIAQSYFRIGINSSGSKVNTPKSGRYNISRYPVGSKNIPTYDELKGYIDELISVNNGWEIWMLHSHGGNITSDAVEDICRIIDYCKANNVEVVSAKEALDYYDKLK